MVHYRTFRNDDPPALVSIWNEAFTTRGFVPLRGTSPLEYFLFSKPYFDPAGFLIAVEDEIPVGFAHAAFGPNQDETKVATDRGVIGLIGVRPAYRRRGIGSELLKRGEAYLQARGTRELYVGCQRPLNPFYLGLYGGSDSPGVLVSDPAAERFLFYHDYLPTESCLVFQRRIGGGFNPADARFAAHRRRYDVRAVLSGVAPTWWQECVIGPLEMLEFRLEDRLTGHPVAQARAWEMQGYNLRWNEAVVGITNLEVNVEHRRLGLGKFLLTQIIRQVQEQYFTLIELQARQDNEPALGLFRSLGFEQVDTGRLYRKDPLHTA